MPNTSSAKKSLRQSKRRQTRNLKKKEGMLSVTRNIKKLVATGKKSEAEKLLTSAYKTFDKSAKSGYIAKNAAARNKSRLARLVAQAK